MKIFTTTATATNTTSSTNAISSNTVISTTTARSTTAPTGIILIPFSQESPPGPCVLGIIDHIFSLDYVVASDGEGPRARDACGDVKAILCDR